MRPRMTRFMLGFTLTLLCGFALTALTGCTPAFGGEVSVLAQPAASYQVQTVQPPDQVQVQTRTRQVMEAQTVTETVPISRTVLVPTTVTELQTRTKTVCVPKLVTEQRTVRVQSPPRQVIVAVQPPQTIAIGMFADEGNPLRNLFNRLRR